MSILDAVNAQMAKTQNAASGNNFPSNEERLKKYFAVILPKGTRNDERRIRILPTKDGSSPFKEVYFHELQVDGKWVKIFDPKQDGQFSPLNIVHDELMSSGLETDKELAKQYRARKFYIVKVIDRDNEADGVKFWRFKHNSKGDGIIDKIFPIFKNKGDITDPETGRDLIISIGLSKANNGKEYTSVNSIIPEDVGPLHTDKKISQEWLDDIMEWADVYSKKPQDYLEMVAKGETPRWNNDLKKWFSLEESNEEAAETLSNNEKEPSMAESVAKQDTQAVYADADGDDMDGDEDLPF